MMKLLPVLLAASAMSFAPAPVAAQDEAAPTASAPATPAPTDSVRLVVVYGDDAPPETVGDEIIVVARKPESERFRIPENLRLSDSPENRSWAARAERFEMIGDFGTLSCDAAGAGGFLGCTQQMIDDFYKDKAEGSDVRFGQLIEMARAERLATIDEDAAAEQERVELLERAYLDRLERERDGPVGDEITDPSAPPTVNQEPEGAF